MQAHPFFNSHMAHFVFPLHSALIRHGSSRSLLDRLLPSRWTSGDCQDLPSSRETLMTIRPALRPRQDRARATGPRVNVPDTAPAPKHNEGSKRFKFRGSITRLLVSLSTPRGDGLPPLHARLASGCWSQLCRAGFQPAGFLRKVSEHQYSSSSPELSWRELRFGAFLSPPGPSLRLHWPLSTRHLPSGPAGSACAQTYPLWLLPVTDWPGSREVLLPPRPLSSRFVDLEGVRERPGG